MVLDEIQRAPELFLAIKATVDADPWPGRFLLTIELWPLSQGEIDGRTDPRRRARFFESYLADLINRDIRQLGEIERLAQSRAVDNPQSLLRPGDEFGLAGYVLHTGPETLPFGPKLRAVPISALWQVS